MERREFMTMLALGFLSATGGCSLLPDGTVSPSPAADSPSTPPSVPPTPPPSPSPTPSPTPTHSELWLQDGPVTSLSGYGGPPSHVITGLPEDVGNVVALTIDDGASTEVVDAYLDFIRDSGVRLTFFVTGSYDSWTDLRDKLLPFVDSGQVQLGNHTWTHPGLTNLSDSDIIAEISACENLLNNSYGVTGAPFVRPPFGYRNARTDAACAQLGYTTPTMWYGSFGDANVNITEEILLGEAEEWLLANHIVIGHANLPPITNLYPQIVEILRERSLLTATLDDVYYGPGYDRHI